MREYSRHLTKSGGYRDKHARPARQRMMKNSLHMNCHLMIVDIHIHLHHQSHYLHCHLNTHHNHHTFLVNNKGQLPKPKLSNFSYFITIVS